MQTPLLTHTSLPRPQKLSFDQACIPLAALQSLLSSIDTLACGHQHYPDVMGRVTKSDAFHIFCLFCSDAKHQVIHLL